MNAKICRLVLLAPAFTGAGAAGRAQDEGPKYLEEREIRDLFTDATASGRNMRSGVAFSECYAQDGQIWGDSGGQPSVDGCWAVSQARMCFSYGPSTQRRTLCWSVVRNGKMVFFQRPNESIEWIATLERGNPRKHAAPKPWSCELAAVRADMMSPRSRTIEP